MKKKKSMSYELSLFSQEEDSELYRKYEETHFQKAYTYETMRKLIEESGLEFVTAYDAFTHVKPTEKSERIYMIARERGK